MREILSDLVAEQQQLDQFLQTLRDRQWSTPTPAEGWTIQDTVSHLAYTEAVAAEVLEQGADRLAEELQDFDDLDAWTARGVEQGRGRRHQEIIEWWRFGRADVVEALSRMLATDRVPWLHGDMSARTFATTRLMETWAHGLDVKAAILGRITPLAEPPDDDDEEYEDPLADTPRLRHIAYLGQKTLPFAFAQAGEDYPESGIRVEVMGPLYAAWRFGPEDTDQVIKGMAGDWCRLVVQRIDPAYTGLKAVGEHAEKALTIATAY